MRIAIAAALVLTASVSAQQPAVELRKVRTMVDRDGKAFGHAPFQVAALPGGRYAIQEVNVLPVVIDSTGRLVKRFSRGDGPGEFRLMANGLAVIRDTLYAGNGQSYNVFSPDLKFVRTMRLSSLYAGSLIPVREGFAIATGKYEGRANSTAIHIVRPSGELVRSFIRDTVLPKQGPPSYYLSAAADGNLWVAAVRHHRLEKWATDGRRISTLAPAPAWFDTTRQWADGRFAVAGAVESVGVLWVLTFVPTRDHRKIIAEGMRGRGNEVDPRLIPEHRLYSTRLEAYEVRSGRMVADVSLDVLPVAFVNARQFMTYTEGDDDQPRLEIWEMKLKR